MKLRLALRRQQGDPVDLVVTADATATVADIANAITESDPATQFETRPADVLTLRVSPPESPSPAVLDPRTLVGDAALGSGFDTAVVRAPIYPVGPTGHESAIALLRVHAGPDAGVEARLRPGTGFIGRGPDNTVRLTDPMVSQRHARIEASATGIEIVDLNSANGILVDGGLVPRLRVDSGQRFLLGDSQVSISLLAAAEDVTDGILERGGALHFNRSPRVERRYPGDELAAPTIPTEKQKPPFNWALMAAPALMGPMMFLMTGNARSLLFVLLSPLMAIANFVSQRTRFGKQSREEVARFELQFDALEEKLESEHPVEREVRLRESPSVSEVYLEAHGLRPMLWTRRPEHWNFLDLRLGIGSMPSRTTIAARSGEQGLPEFGERIDELRERMRMVDGVPVVENPFLAGAIGICGSRGEAADVARALLVQCAGLHSPAEIAFAALLAPAATPEFEWMKWLPHSFSPHSPLGGVALADSASSGAALLDALEELVAARRMAAARRRARGAVDDDKAAAARGARVGSADAASVFGDGGAALILLIDNDVPIDRGRLVRLAEDAADAHVFPIWLAPTPEALPAACRTFVDVRAGLEEASVHFVRLGTVADPVRVEGVSERFARVLARRLAPVADAGAVLSDSSDLPRNVSLLQLLGTEMAADPQTAVDRWRQNDSIADRSGREVVGRRRAGTLRALVGQSSPDALHLDLRTQGPHALVGGTTGSGKSEFLQAWVLGMAAEYSPDRVTFLFVDYKGGSAFAECVTLPHCVGLVTDLSPHLVRRALTSLRAELHHREHLFNRKKAKELIELEKRGDPDAPPALVLVIDEFAALASDVPEFVDGVVDIAQRGRSLGIHLIMATQRPAGVIKDNLRANTNLRVALRMADESDSRDVVGDPVAGTFDPSIPGRGIAKTGPGRLTPFQSGYAGGWTSDEPETATVAIGELRFGAQTAWEPPTRGTAEAETDTGPNDQKRLVTSLIRAAQVAAVPPPRRPWLDELPSSVDLETLATDGDSRMLIGLADIAERQLQEPVWFVPDRDGAMLVYGTSGSGKSTALRTLAVAAGRGAGSAPAAVEVFGLDFGSGALRALEALPHVGSIVAGDDPERIQRLLRALAAELDRRGRAFSDADAASLTDFRRATGRQEPRILLLLDGFAQFRSEWEGTTARAPFYGILMRILGEGRQLGVHVVATADRYGSVPTAVSANVTRRIVLRLADDGGYASLGVPKDILNDGSPPGRAIIDGLETQVAVLGGTPNAAEQSRHLVRIAEELRAAGTREVAAVGALPTELDPGALPVSVEGEPALGIADDTLAPRGFDPIGTFMVTGPPQSGKTTAMRSIIAALLRFDPDVRLFHIGGRRSQLGGFAPWVTSATTPDAVRDLAKQLVEVVPDDSIPGRILVVVEGVTQFADSSAERPLKELFQAINRSDHLLIGDADVSTLSSGFGYVGDFRAGRRGVVLQPDSYDGDSLFKVPFPKVKRADFPAGRGIFVQGGRLIVVQMPQTSDEPIRFNPSDGDRSPSSEAHTPAYSGGAGPDGSAITTREDHANA